MKFTKLPTNTFEKLQMNAGILLSSFEPSTATVTASNIIGATSGGCSFEDTINFVDLGDGIDNCPKNTKELKRIESREVKISGTFLTVDTTLAKKLMASADIDSSDDTKIIPRDDISGSDFSDIWWVGDYSDKNGTSGGYIAIKLANALSTGGFKVKSSDKSKGEFAFEFTAHYSTESADTVPYEVYIKAGTN